MATPSPFSQPAPASLDVLQRLLALARPGALYPDAAKLVAWLLLLQRPSQGGRPPRLALHASGFPPRRSLVVLTRLQAAAQRLKGERRLAALARDPAAFTAALLASALPPLGLVEARLVAKGGSGARFVVVHELLDGATGCPVRFTAQLEERGGRHLTLGRGDQARVSKALEAALRARSEDTAEAVLRALRALPGLVVDEVVRGQLGPFAEPSRVGALPPLADAVAGGAPGDGLCALTLERAGTAVAKDFDGHPWLPLDVSAEAVAVRASGGYRVARELRLVCTPGLEPAVRAVVAATGRAVVVRSR